MFLTKLCTLLEKQASLGQSFEASTFSTLNLLPIIDDELKKSVAIIFKHLPAERIPKRVSAEFFVDQVRDEFIVVTRKKLESDGPLDLNVELTTMVLQYLQTLQGFKAEATSLLDAMNKRLQ